MNWLACVGVGIGALTVMYAAHLIWVGMTIAEEDNEDHH